MISKKKIFFFLKFLFIIMPTKMETGHKKMLLFYELKVIRSKTTTVLLGIRGSQCSYILYDIIARVREPLGLLYRLDNCFSICFFIH